MPHDFLPSRQFLDSGLIQTNKLEDWLTFNPWLEVFLPSVGPQEILVLKYAGVTLTEPFNQKEILVQQKCKTCPIAYSCSCVKVLEMQLIVQTAISTTTHPQPLTRMGLNYQILVWIQSLLHVPLILDLEFCSATAQIQRVTDTVTETWRYALP